MAAAAATSVPWELDWSAAEDVSQAQDGSVLKLVDVPGAGNKLGGVPVRGCLCDVHATGWLPDSKAMFLTTRDELGGQLVGGADEPLQVHLGFGAWVRVANAVHATHCVCGRTEREAALPAAMDSMLGGMQVGEAAWFWLDASAGYGGSGDGGRVPPAATLALHVELLGFAPPAPPPPPRADVDAQRAAAEEDEKAAFLANPPPSWEERLREAGAAKEEGNAAVAAGDWGGARTAYNRGMVHLFLSRQEVAWTGVPPSTLAAVRRAKGVLHLNRAAVHAAEARHLDAEWDANEALAALAAPPAADEKLAAKALFRRGCARLARVEEQVGRAGSGAFWDAGAAQDALRAAAQDLEAAGGVRAFTVEAGRESASALARVPPPGGHDRVRLGARMQGATLRRGAVAEALQRCHTTQEALRAAVAAAKARERERYGGVLLARAGGGGSGEGGEGLPGDEEGVPELGD